MVYTPGRAYVPAPETVAISRATPALVRAFGNIAGKPGTKR